MIIKMADLRTQGVCMDGARRFCNRYGIDWTGFLVSGIESDDLLALDDAMVSPVVEKILIAKGVTDG